MRKELLAVLSLVVFLGPSAFAEQGTWRYTESIGQDVAWIVYSVTRSAQRVVVRSEADRVTEELQWVPGKGTVLWSKKGSHPGTALRAQRRGNVIELTGTLKGEKVSKKLEIDSAPWYQIIGPAISDLLPPSKQSSEFWVLDPDELVGHKMLATRNGTERMEIKHVLLDTYKVHIAPMGIAGSFWGADYWFRPKDGAYLMSKMPGSGVLVTTAVVW